MTEPRFGEVSEYGKKINTPSSSWDYYANFHAPLVTEAKSKSPNSLVNVLAVSCGPAYEFWVMKNDPGLRLIGFDIAPELVREAKKSTVGFPARSDFIIGDTRHSPIADGTIDVAMAINAVIYNPEAVLDTLHQALKQDGKCAVNFRVFGNEHNKPFYDAQVERGAILGDEELDVNGEKFKLKVVNYATHKTLPQLGRQVYFTSEEDIERFIAAKGFIIDRHSKYNFYSPDNPGIPNYPKDPDNPGNEVEVYTLRKP